jgi:hypothetical protein
MGVAVALAPVALDTFRHPSKQKFAFEIQDGFQAHQTNGFRVLQRLLQEGTGGLQPVRQVRHSKLAGDLQIASSWRPTLKSLLQGMREHLEEQLFVRLLQGASANGGRDPVLLLCQLQIGKHVVPFQS